MFRSITLPGTRGLHGLASELGQPVEVGGDRHLGAGHRLALGFGGGDGGGVGSRVGRDADDGAGGSTQLCVHHPKPVRHGAVGVELVALRLAVLQRREVEVLRTVAP